ncbi:unnamed protein product [marine sediment metagenome]|uniref:Uncharacterized protein n=1 Tax=marine sediment metagenome TaxID=412755 RepID=X0S3E0_9ZZZZ
MFTAIKLAPTEDAETSESIPVGNSPVGIIAYSADGVIAEEDITIQVSHNNEDWQDLYSEGDLVALTSTNVAATLLGPAWFRAVKPITTNAVGIFIVGGV